MIEKLRNLRHKKGFTLVELIVVLVILAVLAAILIPSLSGYVDKANKRAIIAEGRSALLAAQTIASEQYAQGTAAPTVSQADVQKLAEVTGTVTVTMDTTNKAKVSKLVYSNNSKTATYKDGSWSVS